MRVKRERQTYVSALMSEVVCAGCHVACNFMILFLLYFLCFLCRDAYSLFLSARRRAHRLLHDSRAFRKYSSPAQHTDEPRDARPYPLQVGRAHESNHRLRLDSDVALQRVHSADLFHMLRSPVGTFGV